MGYLTPDVTPDKVTCRALFVPDDPAYLAIVRGALQELTFPYNWSKFGTLTPEQAASNFVQMFDDFCFDKKGCRVIGEIITYAGAESPNENWLACDGRSVLISDFPDLYNVIGDVYGSAPSGRFRLPDLRGRASVGVGAGSGITEVTLGEMYGSESHTLTTGELPAHSHSEITAVSTIINGGLEAPASSAVPSIGSTGNTGNGDAFSIVGPRIGLTMLIVAKEG